MLTSAHVEVDLGDMVDDAAIDSFLLDFKRKSRMPFAATTIQSFWRMARQRRAFHGYKFGKKQRGFEFKHCIFKAWHAVTVAQTLCRAFCLNICFRHWIRVVMDSKGWVNFCSEACNILSQRPTGLPGPILWNLCIQPSTWVAAQDDERTLGDPLPVRALVVALQVALINVLFFDFRSHFFADFAILLLKMHTQNFSALDESIQVGCRSACQRKIATGALASISIQREVSPQISNVGSMGFFLSCKAPSYTITCFYGTSAFLEFMD